jgi:predicted transcriptional regulator
VENRLVKRRRLAQVAATKQQWRQRKVSPWESIAELIPGAVFLPLRQQTIQAKGEAHMATIIAGRFGQQEQVQEVIAEMVRKGFSPERISSFYVNPPGRHNEYSIGGDHDKSTGAEDSPKGSAAGLATGGTVGAAVGAATAPVTGPLGVAAGALVGAHIGNLVGSLGAMDDDGKAVARKEVPIRKSGMVVAVSVPEPASENQAVEVLRTLGAEDIERAEGTIVDGDWKDFDPVSPPALIEDRPATRS